ncbi:hypothetical protein UPYG_G00322490 [Umbra pygmaea]|uniref:Uncharacterized protein n=1 Tax=Umbra pygmaea TaxID=75934 RepID=A0ABD0W5D0_UMBPY
MHEIVSLKEHKCGGGVATNGAAWEPNLHHRVCGRHFLTGCPNPDPGHPDFAPSQHLGPELTDPTTSVKRAAAKQGRYHRAVRRRLFYSAAGPEPEIVPDRRQPGRRGQTRQWGTISSV